MKSRQFLSVLLLVLAAGVGSARAGTVLYDSASLISGQGGATQSFNLSTPGTLTISITNIPWLDVVADLNCFLSTPTGVVGSKMYAAGSETFNVGAGTYYASWFGDAQGTFNEGVVGVKIQFQPATAVSLPASLILLLSGLGVFFGWQRPRTPDLAYLDSIPSRS
jgi:hypothetical protein